MIQLGSSFKSKHNVHQRCFKTQRFEGFLIQYVDKSICKVNQTANLPHFRSVSLSVEPLRELGGRGLRFQHLVTSHVHPYL